MLQLQARLGVALGTKAINRKQVLLAIMIKAGSQADLARRTGLAQSTVSSVVRELQDDGVVAAGKNGHASTSGRRPTVCLSPTRGVAVGVHLGFNHAMVVARRVDQPIAQTHQEFVQGGANRSLQEITTPLKRAVEDAVAATGLGLDDVLSLGVAVPGMVDPRSGSFANPVIPPWKPDDRPARDLAHWLGVPEALDNDANLGALAEQTYTTDGDAEMVVYIKASTGVGAGLVIANIPIRGHRGIAGEIGHLVMDPDGDVCYCGGRGCLETVIGADALLRQVRNSLSGKAADIPRTLASLIDRAQAAEADSMCVRVLQDAGRMLGRAVAHLCNLLNPDLIVIGGQLAAAGDLLLEPCKQALKQHALRGAVDDLVLRTSSLGDRTEAQGALVLGLASLRRRDEGPDTPEKE
jgi:predicted NBD/HSP70 family sugar kinase